MTRLLKHSRTDPSTTGIRIRKTAEIVEEAIHRTTEAMIEECGDRVDPLCRGLPDAILESPKTKITELLPTAVRKNLYISIMDRLMDMTIKRSRPIVRDNGMSLLGTRAHDVRKMTRR